MKLKIALITLLLTSIGNLCAEPLEKLKSQEVLAKIHLQRDNPQVLAELIPIVRCSFKPSKYEQILMGQLRNKNSTMKEFREASDKIGELLIYKVVEILPTQSLEIDTPLVKCESEVFASNIELVSIMRSGDALLNTFMNHFPHANITKILVQRDEETAEPIFTYLKVSPTIASGNTVVITEPMIATGGTLNMVISLLKDKGVREENILIASICTAPEGLLQLNQKFPSIKVVMTVMDEKLNEKKYIVPGLGDFGDRYFGTTK